MFLKKNKFFILISTLSLIGGIIIFFYLLLIQKSTLKPIKTNTGGSAELSKPSILPETAKKMNTLNESTGIYLTNQFGEVVLTVAPIPGVPSSTSQFISINDGLLDEQYYPVPWLTKSTRQPVYLTEHVDPNLNIRFLYPANRGKLEWDPKNKEFFIKSNYRLDDWTASSFRISFSKNISLPRVDIGYASPSHFCAKRLAARIPLGGILGCYNGADSSLVGQTIIQGWDNDAGYMGMDADAELSDHPDFQSVTIKLEYSNLETEEDTQTLLYILDSIRKARWYAK